MIQPLYTTLNTLTMNTTKWNTQAKQAVASNRIMTEVLKTLV